MSGSATGALVYFAYGSNMLWRRLKAADRAPSACAIETGFVTGRRLAFDKLGIDGSGKCDIEATGDASDRVYGVLFALERADKPALDRAEGLGTGYDHRVIRVVTESGVRSAVTYVAKLKAPGLKPFHWYKDIVVAGALEHGLPDEYIERLRAVGSREDPNIARRRAQEAILACHCPETRRRAD